MTYARIKMALRKCCGYDEEEGLSSVQEEVKDGKVLTKINLQNTDQLVECFSQFKGNWGARLARGELPAINAQLNDYLLRYHQQKGVTWITALSATRLPLIDATTTTLNFHPVLEMPTWHANGFAVSSTLDHYYNAAVFASCLVYFANSVAELIELHKDTIKKFQDNLDRVSNPEWQKLTIPPIFLVVTDQDSILHHPETLEKLAALSIPILHSVFAPNSGIDIMTHTARGDYVDNLFWQSLIKHTIAPCYEKLSVATGLLEKERLPLENSIMIEKNGSWETLTIVEYDDSTESDSDEDVAEMTQEALSEPVEKQPDEQVVVTDSAVKLPEEKTVEQPNVDSGNTVTDEEVQSGLRP